MTIGINYSFALCMKLSPQDVETYATMVKSRILALVKEHNTNMLTTWLLSKGYLEINTIYEQELAKVYKGPWDDKTVDKLWMTMKNLVFAIQTYVTIHNHDKLLEFMETMMDFQISSFYADFEELVDRSLF